MPTHAINAAAAGTWTLGDQTVNRIGFGAKRLPGSVAPDAGISPDRDRVIGLLRRALDLGIKHIDTAVASNDAVLAVARARQVTPAQVRVAWALHRGPHVLAIPGTGNPDHLAENIAAGTLHLSADEMASLD